MQQDLLHFEDTAVGWTQSCMLARFSLLTLYNSALYAPHYIAVVLFWLACRERVLIENLMSFFGAHHQIMKALGKLSLFDSVCKGSTNGNQRKSMSRVLAIYCVHCHIVLSMRRCIYKLCRWILARYDVDVLDYYDTKQAVVDYWHYIIFLY